MTHKEKLDLWSKIFVWADAFLHKPAEVERAAKDVEKAIDDIARAASRAALAEALNSGDGTYKP